jgi:hypothetical protein
MLYKDSNSLNTVVSNLPGRRRSAVEWRSREVRLPPLPPLFANTTTTTVISSPSSPKRTVTYSPLRRSFWPKDTHLRTNLITQTL